MTAASLTAAPYLRSGLMDVPPLVALTAAVLTGDGRFADGRPLPSVGLMDVPPLVALTAALLTAAALTVVTQPTDHCILITDYWSQLTTAY